MLYKVILILCLFVYLVFAVVVVNSTIESNRVKKVFSDVSEDKPIKMLGFEREIFNKIKVDQSKLNRYIIIERCVLTFTTLFVLFQFRGLGFAVVGALALTLLFDYMYKAAIYDSGVTSVPEVVNFINNFIPKINGGESARQAFLSFIDNTQSDSLMEYYTLDAENNKERSDKYVAKSKAESIIIDIYRLARYNEESGITNYTYILEELLADMNQKQVYFNNFNAKIGEVKPIAWAYYIGVPILIALSYSITYQFWQGLGGWIVSAILLVMFAAFKFLFYKIQKKSIRLIF